MTSGRNTTPVPTLAKGPRGDLAFHNWLIENALNEARANRDTLRQTIFRYQLENLNKTKKGGRVELTESELDDANVYLWEYQPKPIKILKPLESRKGSGLDESVNSDFARAVDAVVDGDNSVGYLKLGTTPSVLRMVGLPNVKVSISRATIKKVIAGKHRIDPESLKQLPVQINNPVAIMKSSPKALKKGYVVLTEITEQKDDGGAEPVIVALHLRETSGGYQVINIVSAYGKNLRGIQNMLNHDVVYWNKTKGSQLANAFGLQLPSQMRSDANLSNSNIKTESDLSQYLASNDARNPLESRVNNSQRDLMVTHNLTERNLLHAHKMGGIPMASLAVTTKENPLSSFGEITLIGNRDYIDPEGSNKAKVFGSDIYSPRYPTIFYDISKQDSDNLNKRFSGAAKELERHNYEYDIVENIRKQGLESALHSDQAVMYQFLKDKKIPVEIVYKEVQPSGHEHYQSVKSALQRHRDNVNGLMDDELFYREYANELLANVKKRAQSSNKLEANLSKRQVNTFEKVIKEDNLLRNHLLQSHVASVTHYANSKNKAPGVDSYRTGANIRKAIEANQAKFDEYVKSIADAIPVNENIYNGTDRQGRAMYQAHTLENVVRKLKKDLRGGEGFSYGLGSVRSLVTPQFRSIQEIQKHKDRLVSHDDFKRIRDEMDNEVSALSAKLGRDGLMLALDVLDIAATKSPVAALEQFNIEKTPERIAAINELLAKLESMPTEYFEGKAKDITQFSDFVGAVIPSDIEPSARKILEDAGLRLFEYGKKEGAREDVVTKAVDTLDSELGGNVLFSRKGQELPTPNDKASGKTSKAQLQSVIDKLDIADKNVEAVQVFAVKDSDELKAMTGYDMRSDSEALYFPAVENSDGTISPAEIYLVCDHISDTNRATEVLQHELIGHFGMESLLGEKFADVLSDAKRVARAPKIVSKKYLSEVKAGQKYYATLEAVQQRYPDYSESDQLREVLARMAETRKEIGLLNRVYRQIRQFLQRIGLVSRNLKDIEYMLTESAKRLREGNASRTLQGAVMASRSLDSRGQSKLTYVDKAKILQGSPVAVLKDRQAPIGYPALRKWAIELFNGFGNKAINPEIGEVILNEKSVRDSMGHRINPFKAEAFRSIKDVIEKGVVVASQDISRDTHHFISAPVEIEGVQDIVTVLVKRDMNTQRMYLHSVITKENLLKGINSKADAKLASEQNGLSPSGGSPQDQKISSADIASILRDYLNYKPSPLESRTRNTTIPNVDDKLNVNNVMSNMTSAQAQDAIKTFLNESGKGVQPKWLEMVTSKSEFIMYIV